VRAVAGPIEELRALESAATPPPPVMKAYLAKVRTGAYSVTDGDVEELKRAGVTEDVIFEATVAVAIGEGLRRLDAALRVIE
jgi:alkylhydroperoxidase family enzyme